MYPVRKQPNIRSSKLIAFLLDKILGNYGKEMTWDIKAGCMARSEKEASLHLLSFFPDIPLTVESLITQRNVLQDLAWPTVSLLPGVQKLVLHLKKHNIPIAVATGSRRKRYEMKTAHLSDVFDCFEGKVVCSDDPREGMRGKPNPDIFLAAAKEMLGREVGPLKGEQDVQLTEEQKKERSKGLVFEDALPGLQAGKRAGMAVVWIPDANLLNLGYPESREADQILSSMEEFVPEEWGLPPFDV